MKKKICFLLSLALTLLSVYAAADNTMPFADVPPEHWAYDAISYFYSADVINGMHDTAYAPDESITREQLAKLLSVLFGRENASAGQTFADVPAERWSFPYIESVKEYLTGYFPAGGAPFFNPAAKATREDLAYALVRISGLKAGNVAVLDAFSDASSISPMLSPYVAAAVEHGLLQGYNGFLRPQDGISRAETAMLLFRAIKKPVDVVSGEAEVPEEKPVLEVIPETEGADTPSPVDTPLPEAGPSQNPMPAEKTLLFTDFQQISGYRDDEIRGELRVSFDSAAPQFSADLKCYEGLGYTLCEIRLEEHTAVSADTLSGYFTVSMNGTPRHTHLRGTVQFSDGFLTLHTEDYDYHLVAHTSGDTPAAPDTTAKADKVERLPSLTFSVLSEEEATSGVLWLTYDEAGTAPSVQGEFSVGGKAYKINSVSVSAYSSESVAATFSVAEDGVPLSAGIEGTLTGLDAGLGGSAYFRSTDGSFNLSLLITEIAA